MKKQFILCLLFLLTISLTAQDRKFVVGASFNLQFPTSDFNELAKAGVGWSLVGEYLISKQLSLLLSGTSYSNESKIPRLGTAGKTVDFSIKSVDLLVGARYYMNKSFFGIIESGVRYLKITAVIYTATSASKTNESTDYEPQFSFNVGAGYRLHLAERSAFDISAVYHIVNVYKLNLSAVTTRAALLVYF